MTALRTILTSISFAVAALAFSPVAFAGDAQIEAAISAGEVGERIDGYLGVVGTADAAIVRKVQDINNRRRSVYEQTASENGTTVQIVARLAGEKQIARIQPGEHFMDESGVWQKK